MKQRSKSKKGDPNLPYYIVIGVFIVVCVGAVLYMLFNPKQTFINKQVIDADEFLVHNS
jgi:hypothetical protein